MEGVVSANESALQACPRLGARKHFAANQREELKEYLYGPAQVSWQDQRVQSVYWGANIQTEAHGQ